MLSPKPLPRVETVAENLRQVILGYSLATGSPECLAAAIAWCEWPVTLLVVVSILWELLSPGLVRLLLAPPSESAVQAATIGRRPA